MTQYATHRFSVGQQVVVRSGETPSSCAVPNSCAVTAQIAGRDGPEYRVKSLDNSFEAVVPERDVRYTPALASISLAGA